MHQELEKLSLNHKHQNNNTNSPSWKDIPEALQSYILDFLSPIEALPCISISNADLKYFGNFIIQRLRNEKLPYTMFRLCHEHTLAMRRDGKLFAWGEKLSGPLGHRRISDPYTPDTPQLINPNQFQGKTLQSIYADNTYTLVLCNDNSLFAWGESRAGQLGLGHTNNQHTPRQINPNCFQGKTIQYIYKGNLHNLALCQDGTLFSWGHNYFGELGLGHRQKQNSPQRIHNEHFQGKTLQSIQTGLFCTYALCTDGTLFSWGCNDHGQLGLGNTTEYNTPQQINHNHFYGRTIQSIHTGRSYTLALSTDGSLFAWGYNIYGQLGLGHTNNQHTPQQINPNCFQGKTIQSFYPKENHTLALCANGSLFSWGNNDDGQLGLGHNNSQTTPQQIDPNKFQDTTIQSIYACNYHSYALCTNGTLFAWGRNFNGELGLGHTNSQNTPQQINIDHFHGRTIQSIHTGTSHTLAQCTDNTIFVWGFNNYGQLGLGHEDNILIPKQLPDPLNRDFRVRHQNLLKHHVFFNTPDPKSRFLSKCVFNHDETAQSRTEDDTCSMAKK